MPELLYRVKFLYHNATSYDKLKFELLYQGEFMRAYNEYADITNAGLTKALNEEFDSLHPNYFEDNKGKDWTELVEYNRFMADGYTQYAAYKVNMAHPDSKLEYFVEPEEVAFSARFKWHREASVDFVMVSIEK